MFKKLSSNLLFSLEVKKNNLKKLGLFCLILDIKYKYVLHAFIFLSKVRNKKINNK